MFTKRSEYDDVLADVATTRTEIRDIPELGPELDESQLAAVVGGFFSNTGTGTDPKCGGCH